MSKANESVTEVSVKKIALGISIFIFLSTLPYWLVDRDSNFSIINLIFSKVMGQMGDVELDAETSLSLQWAKYYFHLIITSIGLLIYFFSDTSKYIGYALSRFYMGKFFHGNSKAMNQSTRILKIIITSVFIITIYLLLMGLIDANTIPIRNFNYVMLTFLVLLITWNVGYPEFFENTSLSGEYDYRNKLK